MKNKKVTSINKNKVKLTLAVAMAAAVSALLDATGENPKVSDVIYYIIRHHGYKWASSTIQSYFSQMSKPRAFVRTSRGHYRNVGNAAKNSVA